MIGEKISREELHRTFAGVITENDFYRHTTLAQHAAKVISNLYFDRDCKKAIDLKNNNGDKEWKNV